jgi:hypothetical protein
MGSLTRVVQVEQDGVIRHKDFGQPGHGLATTIKIVCVLNALKVSFALLPRFFFPATSSLYLAMDCVFDLICLIIIIGTRFTRVVPSFGSALFSK